MAVGDANQDPFQAPDLQAFAKTIVNTLVSVEAIERYWKGSEPTFVKIVEIALGTIMGLLGTIGAELAKAIMAGEDIAEPAFRRLASAALKDITGVDADISLGVGRGDERRAQAQTIGAGILKALSGISAGGTGTGSTLAPSTKPAEDYLGFVVNMAMEGWLTDITGEMVTLGMVEQLGDLDDALAGALGLARTSRAVLRPFMNATVETPARWQLNKTYRPELLAVGEAVRQYLRGRWTIEQLREELGRQGWSDERIEAHVNAQRKFLSVDELYDRFELDLTTDEEAIQHLRDQGWDEATASNRWQLRRKQPFLKEQDAIAAAAVNAYVNWEIDDGQLDAAFAAGGVRPYALITLRKIATERRKLNRPNLSEGEFRQAVKRGIRTTIEYRAYLRRRGFDEEAIATKELLLRDEINTAADLEKARTEREAELAAEKDERERKAREREEQIARDKAVTEPSRRDVETAFVHGLVSEDFYRAFLVTEKYDADSVSFLIDLAREARDKYDADKKRRDELAARGDVEPLSIAQLERAVAGGHLSIAEYGGILRERKYAAGDVALLQRVMQDRLEEIADAQRRREEAERRAAEQGLSIGQIEQAVLRGIVGLDAYDAWLRSAAFDDVDRGVLVRLLAARLDDYNAERARREENERRAAIRGISLDDLERAVLAGISTFADYETALIKSGFEPANVQTMVALLRLEKETRDDAEQRRREAEERAGERGLSLADLGRAVRWNILTLDQYRAALDQLGYRGADADVIVETLVRELQAQRDDERRREELREEARRAKLPLQDVERAVLAGFLSPDDYAARLETFGYGTDDRAILLALLDDELAEVERQRAARGSATTELQAREISLGDFEAAVRARVRSIEEYAGFLQQQGFDQASRSTLIALLARELGDVDRAAQLRQQLDDAADPRLAALVASEDAVAIDRRTLREHFDALVTALFSQEDAALLTLWLDQQLYAKKAKAPGGSNG